MLKLGKDFYCRKDVVQISKELIGKFIFTKLDGNKLTGGIIVETEAYAGAIDKASHAFGYKRTKRTEIMFHEGGVAYVYLCYGIHALFNIVTNTEGIPDAVLIRAIQPVEGINIMLARRNKKKLDRSVAGGPGALSQALGINCSHNGIPLFQNKIWIAEKGNNIDKKSIIASKRVGVDYAGVDALLPYRFKMKDNNWTSIAK